jgi:hypothetical protein
MAKSSLLHTTTKKISDLFRWTKKEVKAMGPDWATALGTWFTVIPVTISIFLVWTQIGDLRTSVENQTYQYVYQTEFDLHRYFLEHPDERRYFYEDKDIEADVDEKKRVKLFTLAEWWCDFFDNVYRQKATMPPNTFNQWRRFMKDIYRTSPVLREFIAIKGKQGWYPKDYLDDIKDPNL